MKKVDFIKLEDEVRQILIDNPQTREDDMYLYYVYCVRKNPKFYNPNDFITLFTHKVYRNSENIKNFVSVERCRRKIQLQYPELASKRVKQAREEQIEEYKDYSRL